MASIDIERTHQLDAASARALVDKVARALEREFGMRSRWHGDVLELAGSGIDGAIALGAGSIHVTARLGLLLHPLRATIEQHIRRRLDQYLA